MNVRGVIFDLGGVVLGSPFEAIARFERKHGIHAGFIPSHIAKSGSLGAFARLERGELDIAAFGVCFADECRASGVTVDGAALVQALDASMTPRPSYLEALSQIRARGVVAAALTNNWRSDTPAALAPLFDVFLESAKLGMRKPDPRIYELACGRMQLAPQNVAYLDDIGSNLKPARALGMHTILVRDPELALGELALYLGFALDHA